MFKSFYRSLVIAQTARAAMHTLRYLTAQQMVALNINPQTFVAEQIAAVKAEFDATDRLKAQTSVQAVLSQTVNPNLVGAV